MNLLTLLFRLSAHALRGFLQLGEALHDHAEQELRDPASVRRQLERPNRRGSPARSQTRTSPTYRARRVGRLLS